MLGNHDFAISRDPFSQPVEIVELTHGTLLADSVARASSSADAASSSPGVDPRTWLARRQARVPRARRPTSASCSATFPRALPGRAGRFHLALAGHLHGGQIVLPYGFGRLLLAHPRVAHAQGLFVREGTLLHVSPGLGTTFVPIRFFARPEATELVLRSA